MCTAVYVCVCFLSFIFPLSTKWNEFYVGYGFFIELYRIGERNIEAKKPDHYQISTFYISLWNISHILEGYLWGIYSQKHQKVCSVL